MYFAKKDKRWNLLYIHNIPSAWVEWKKGGSTYLELFTSMHRCFVFVFLQYLNSVYCYWIKWVWWNATILKVRCKGQCILISVLVLIIIKHCTHFKKLWNSLDFYIYIKNVGTTTSFLMFESIYHVLSSTFVPTASCLALIPPRVLDVCTLN